jgi:hypothetical protein
VREYDTAAEAWGYPQTRGGRELSQSILSNKVKGSLDAEVRRRLLIRADILLTEDPGADVRESLLRQPCDKAVGFTIQKLSKLTRFAVVKRN